MELTTEEVIMAFEVSTHIFDKVSRLRRRLANILLFKEHDEIFTHSTVVTKGLSFSGHFRKLYIDTFPAKGLNPIDVSAQVEIQQAEEQEKRIKQEKISCKEAYKRSKAYKRSEKSTNEEDILDEDIWEDEQLFTALSMGLLSPLSLFPEDIEKVFNQKPELLNSEEFQKAYNNKKLLTPEQITMAISLGLVKSVESQPQSLSLEGVPSVPLQAEGISSDGSTSKGDELTKLLITVDGREEKYPQDPQVVPESPSDSSVTEEQLKSTQVLLQEQQAADYSLFIISGTGGPFNPAVSFFGLPKKQESTAATVIDITKYVLGGFVLIPVINTIRLCTEFLPGFIALSTLKSFTLLRKVFPSYIAYNDGMNANVASYKRLHAGDKKKEEEGVKQKVHPLKKGDISFNKTQLKPRFYEHGPIRWMANFGIFLVQVGIFLPLMAGLAVIYVASNILYEWARVTFAPLASFKEAWRLHPVLGILSAVASLAGIAVLAYFLLPLIVTAGATFLAFVGSFKLIEFLGIVTACTVVATGIMAIVNKYRHSRELHAKAKILMDRKGLEEEAEQPLEKTLSHYTNDARRLKLSKPTLTLDSKMLSPTVAANKASMSRTWGRTASRRTTGVGLGLGQELFSPVSEGTHYEVHDLEPETGFEEDLGGGAKQDFSQYEEAQPGAADSIIQNNNTATAIHSQQPGQPVAPPIVVGVEPVSSLAPAATQEEAKHLEGLARSVPLTGMNTLSTEASSLKPPLPRTELPLAVIAGKSMMKGFANVSAPPHMTAQNVNEGEPPVSRDEPAAAVKRPRYTKFTPEDCEPPASELENGQVRPASTPVFMPH